MAVPHTVFLGAYVAFKVIFPAFVKWLAYDTYTTALISIWYPLIMTLSWVHDKRQSKESHASPVTSAKHSVSTLSSKDTPTPVEPNSSESSDDRRPAYMRTKASQKLRESTTNKRNPAVFPRTSPPKPETPQRKSQEEGQRRPTSPAMNFLLNNEPEAATRYWLRYWVVFALVQSVGTLATMVPVFGNFVVRHPYVLHICSELKLLFFIWLFSMETLIGAAVVQEDALMAKAMPLNLLHEHIAPLLLELEAVVAESVSKKTWTSLIHSKVQRVLEVFVMLKMLSDHRKDWLLHILDEGRTLLLPSLSLFMPSFITQFGVAYVQFIVPSAKSTRALIAAKQRRTQGSVKNEDVELLYLQYWIIHCLVSGLLGYFSVIIWWIPFSTHATFLVWCHLSFPKSITQSYHVLETELVAFGLLPGKSELQLHETKTVKVIQAVCSRLPSAADKEEKKHEEGSKTGKQESNGDQESSHLPLGRTISVDSQQTSVEVSIREPSKAFVKGRKKACDYDGAMNDNESSAELLEDTNSCKKRPTKHTSVKEDEDDSSMPPIKPSESSTTADTGSTHISHDVASVDSASSNGSTSSNKDPPTNLRRSTRQRRTTT